MLTRWVSTGVLIALTGTSVLAQQAAETGQATDGIPIPEFRVGDRWVYQGVNLWTKEVSWTREQVVDAVNPPNAVFRYKYLASSDPGISAGSTGTTGYFVNIQSDRRSDLLSGVFENVHFPLKEGMTWTHRLKRRYQEGDIVDGEYTAKVVGWEEIKVPAGTFKAMKIEHKGWWRRPEKGWSGREETTLWFAPDAKRAVKALHVDYDTSGNIHEQFETQLVEYQLVKEKTP